MKSKVTPEFRQLFKQLPTDIQQKAKKAYRLFIANPRHHSLRFKKMQDTEIYSARITGDYRALGVFHGEAMLWYWIGSHSGYDHQI